MRENLLFGSQIGVLAENYSGGYIVDNFIIGEKLLIRGESQILVRHNLISATSGVAVEVRRNSTCGISENRIFLESKGCVVFVDGGDVSIVKNELVPHLFSRAIVHVVSQGRVLMEKNIIYSDQAVMNIHRLVESNEDDIIFFTSDNMTRRAMFNAYNQYENVMTKAAALRQVDRLESWLRDTREENGKDTYKFFSKHLPHRDTIIKYGLTAALVIAGITYAAVSIVSLTSSKKKRRAVSKVPLRASQFRWVA